tara:strand:+ start:8526 stop:10049 length:1524 start_codon:yes stop_codon:yes gene_type:complete
MRIALVAGLVGAVVATTAALVALFSSMKDGVAAFAEQEKAVRKLDAALRSSGSYTAEASRSIQTFANELQGSTTATQTQVLELVALGKSFGATNEQAQRLAATSLDFAEGAGLNATEALRRLGRAMQGSAADVANFAPEIRNLTRAQLRLGGATDAISKKFAGQAAAAADTYAGALLNLENAQGRLLEAQGALLVNDPALRESIRQQARLTDQLSEEVEKTNFNFLWLSRTWQILKTGGVNLQLQIAQLGGAFGHLVEATLRHLGIMGELQTKTALARSAFIKLVKSSETLTKNLNTLQSSGLSLTAALNLLYAAHTRNVAASNEHAASAQLLNITLDRLGLRALPEVRTALEQTTEEIERVEEGMRRGTIGTATYERAVADLRLEQEALQAVLDGTAVSVASYRARIAEARAADDLARLSTDQLAASTERFRLTKLGATEAVIAHNLALGEEVELENRQPRDRLRGQPFGPGGLFPGLSGSNYVITTTTDEAGDVVSRDVRPGGFE